MNVVNVTRRAEVFTCNAYLAQGSRNVLIDAGSMPGVVEAVREYTDSLSAVVLTHQHGDHVAMLEEVCDAFNPKVYAYANHDRRTDDLSDGDTVRVGGEEFDVVYTPGHAADHIALVSDSTLFSGDVVVHDDEAFEYGSFGRTDRPGQSRERLIESIQTLLDRMPHGIEHMYPGHGGVFHGDVRDVVETALEHASNREPKYPDE